MGGRVPEIQVHFYVFDPVGVCLCIEVHQHRSKVGIVRNTRTNKAIRVILTDPEMAAPCSFERQQRYRKEYPAEMVSMSSTASRYDCLSPSAALTAFLKFSYPRFSILTHTHLRGVTSFFLQ